MRGGTKNRPKGRFFVILIGMNPQTVIFIGRSGCGKGTQADFLMKHLKGQDLQERPIYYLESGAQFREFISGKSHSSKRARQIYEHGERQPDFLAIWMWSHLLVENVTGEEHLIIDGTPRSMSEALALDTALQFYERKANIIYLHVSREWSQERLLARGRADDTTLSKINKRLDWFDRDVMPAVEHYRNNSAYNFIEINGEQGKEKVHEDIMEKLILY